MSRTISPRARVRGLLPNLIILPLITTLLSYSCTKKEEGRAGHSGAQEGKESPAPDEAQPGAEPRRDAPSVDELRPIVRESGEEGVVPSEVGVVFAIPVVDDPSASVSEKTVVKVSPEVDGALTWRGSSTLIFTPKDAFKPNTAYSLKVVSVEATRGLVVFPGGGFEYTFTTPRFSFVRANFSGFDPKRNRLEVELVYSAPLDVASLKDNASWTASGFPLKNVRYERTDKPNVARATLVDRRIDFGSLIAFAADPGVRASNADGPSAPAAAAEVQVHRGDPITILASYAEEGVNGFYVTVICKDEGSGKEEVYHWDPITSQSYSVSRRCLLDDSEAMEAIHFSPPVKFTISPMHGGFRVLGDFTRGTYAMRIDANARSVDGGVLKKSYAQSLSIPPRKPKISFIAQGRYLPRSQWSNLAIRHMNVSRADLTVRHIPPENLAFWMSGENETADARNSNVIARKMIPLRSESDTLLTSWVDVESLMTTRPRGVIELVLSGEGGAEAKSRLLVTDINLVAKQESNSTRVFVWALDMHDNHGISGVAVKQIVRSGKTIAACTTDHFGGCVLPPQDEKEKALDASAPFALVATRENDITYLKYDELKAEIADSAIQGRPFTAAEAYRAAIYSDRGVVRPGETLHAVAIVRSREDVAPAEGMPIDVRLFDPQKKVAKKMVRKTNASGVLGVDFKFDDFASTGVYRMTLEAGGMAVAEYTFNVEEFVPERMKVVAKTEKADVRITEAVAIEVSAQYLFGGSAAGSRVELACELKPAVFSPKHRSNYQYGGWRPSGDPAPELALGTSAGVLDREGKTKLECPTVSERGALGGTLRLIGKASVFEAGSGRTTQGEASAMIHPEAYYVGLRTAARKIKAGEAVSVEGVIVDWAGDPSSAGREVELELFRVETEHDYGYDQEEGRWSYRHHQRLVSEGKLKSPSVQGGAFAVSVTVSSNAAAFVLRARSGGAMTDLQVEGSEVDWWSAEGEGERDLTPRPLKPAPLELLVPETISVKEKVTASFVSPFKGRALIALETDQLIRHEWVDVSPGKVEWTFAVSSFTPNVYLSAFVIKDPHYDSKEAFLPNRSFGVASIRVDPEEYAHSLKLSVPNEVRSKSKLEVGIDLGVLEEPAVVTVAAVDEGILSVTKFPSPDPLPILFDRRALGIFTFETIGWNLLLPAGAKSRSEGGDGGGGMGRVQPIKPVALWSGIVEVPKSGKVSVSFDVPQYRGSLRVMAVSAGKKRTGSASANVLVRDPLVLATTLPRFLTYGDNVEIPVFVTNVSGSPQTIEVTLAAESLAVPGARGAAESGGEVLQVKGASRKSMTLANQESGTLVFRAKALQAVGAATLRVRAQAGSIASEESLEVPFVPASPRSRELQRIELSEGKTDLRPYLAGWVPTTERSTFWVTSNPYGDAFDHLKHLIAYPYGCIEQTTSTTRPLLYVANLVASVDPALVAKDRIESMVMSGVNRILSMQTPSGGFSYWPGSNEPTHWGTAYATHLLNDAKKLGYAVPEERLKDAFEWMERELTTHIDHGAEAYMHYVLALAGRARKAGVQRLIDDHGRRPSTSELREEMYMLKAGLYLAGDRRYEADLRNPDVSPVTDERSNGWSFYSDRRRRGFMLSTFTDLFGSDPAGEKLANMVAEALRGHPSHWYTTQELVWGVTGLGKWVGETTKTFSPAVLSANGKVVKDQGAGPGAKASDRSWSVARASEYAAIDVALSNTGGGKVFLILSSDGVKENAKYEFGGEGLVLRREYRDLGGATVSLSNGSLRLGDMIYASIAITNKTGERIQNIALVDRFPAAWEIENPRLGRGSTSLSWVDRDSLWTVDSMNLRDDRIELFGALDGGQTKTFVYALRATTAGQFTMPPGEAEAMYYPAYWAREPGARVVVTGPWENVD